MAGTAKTSVPNGYSVVWRQRIYEEDWVDTNKNKKKFYSCVYPVMKAILKEKLPFSRSEAIFCVAVIGRKYASLEKLKQKRTNLCMTEAS